MVDYRKLDKKQMEARDKEIMRLRNMGLCQRVIGVRVRLSTAQVNKTLKRLANK